MFKWFKNKNNEEVKSCRNCYYYGCVKTKTTLNPDKSIIKGGQIKYEWCNKGDFYLNDIEPCEIYRRLKCGEHRSAKIKPPPSATIIPTENSSVETISIKEVF